MILRRLVGIAILVCLSRRTCNRVQYFRARRPCRPCLAYQPNQPIRQVKASKSTRPRNPSISSQPRASRRRRSRPCSSIRPSQPAHSSHPIMRIPANHPMGLRKLYILASLFRIPTVIRLGETFRHVASVILVALLVLTSTASLFLVALLVLTSTASIFRHIIPSILSILGRLSPRWPTTGYDMAGRIGRITIHPHDL